MNSDKKNKIIIISLSIIIGLLILGIILFIVFGKGSDNQKTKTDKKAKEEEKVTPKKPTLSQSEIDAIKKHTDEYISLANNFPINDVDNLDDQKIFWFLTTKISNFLDGFDKEKLTYLIEDYFKDDIRIVYGDIECPVGDGPLLKYDYEKEKYTRVGDHGHGGTSTPRGTIFYEDIVRDDKYVNVKTKIIYGEPCGDICGPIMNYYTVAKFDDQNNSNKVFNLNDPTATTYKESITQDEFDTIKEKIPYTIFKFKIADEDGDEAKYGLVSVTIEDA